MNFIGFGNGKDGDLVVSSTNTIINSYTSLSGSYSAGDKVINVADATNFAIGDAVIVHQSRGTGGGNVQKNRIEGKSGNQLTLSIPFDYGYGDDAGNRQAQLIRCPEYSSVKINNAASIAPTAWNGDIGGIIAYSCNGKTIVDGFFNLKGKGYRGGVGAQDDGGRVPAFKGESSSGPSVSIGGMNGDNSSNGPGGGGGDSVGDWGGGGGGGGHATSGGTGTNPTGNATGGDGGTTIGDAAFTTAHMGAGGGGGGIDDSTYGGQGGDGSGLLFADSYEFVINNSTGYVDMDGINGTSHGDSGGGGGGGAAGGAFVRAVKGDIGTDRFYARGGLGAAGGHAFADGGDGGNAGKGRVRVEVCSLSGSLGSSFADYASVIGGKEWCGSGTVIM
jgi:hypothetical protein